eukprot:5001112-Alexandrium_andersonii.AAC.1
MHTQWCYTAAWQQQCWSAVRGTWRTGVPWDDGARQHLAHNEAGEGHEHGAQGARSGAQTLPALP